MQVSLFDNNTNDVVEPQSAPAEIEQPDPPTPITDPAHEQLPAAELAADTSTPSAADEAFRSPTDFPATTAPLVPSGTKARVQANISAIKLVHTLHAAGRAATLPEQRILAAWSGWGACPDVFDPRAQNYSQERQQLRELLTDAQYRHAQASILNAHYTDPAIAAAIWDALGVAGLRGGRVLEPGCGSGTFISHAPASVTMVGVESDDITAAIAALLYPTAHVRHEGFETTRLPEAAFTAAIGNVPFGRYALTDPVYNPERHNIHNHFIIKSLALVAPGGYVAVLTSRYTMDAAKTAARTQIAQQADLIGAVRLPSKAFSRVAGTDVVTDLLILRRHDIDYTAPDHMPEWVNTEDVDVTNPDTGHTEQLCLNSYYSTHPDHVLGQAALGHGLHGSPTLVIDGPTGSALGEQIRTRLTTIIDAALARGRGLTAPADPQASRTTELTAGLHVPTGQDEEPALYTLRYNDLADSIDYWAGQGWEPNNTPKSLINETRELITLRDAATALITAQRDGEPTAERDRHRAHLNALYDRYVATHQGPLNRYVLVQPTVSQIGHDKAVAKAEREWREQEGEPGRPYDGPVPPELADKWDTKAWEPPTPHKKYRHLEGGMRYDPGWALVSALEIFDDDTQTALKAPIFTGDLLTASIERDTADTPEEALAISLDRARKVDLNLIANLLGVTTTDAHALLDGLVYPSLDDPQVLTPAASALSGNVRSKLNAAIEAADSDPRYEDYVRALHTVQPQPRYAEDIKARPGAPWIPPTVVAAFAENTFGISDVKAEHLSGRWIIDVPSYKRYGRLMTDEWGTAHRNFDAISLLEAVCNSKAVVINNKDGVLDTQATFAAQAKCAKITEEFTRWLWADDERSETLVAEYNRRFSSLRAPAYDGSQLRLPGLSTHFTPHSYQRNAVARILAEPTTLLDHVVGAGKTGTMIMAAMELRRLGLVRQPWVVVPNHIIEQVGREAQQWYPAANILIGSSATTEEGRRRFVAQTATSAWDIVVIPESAFTRINVSDQVRIDYVENQLDQLRTQLSESSIERSKKAIERAIKTASARLEKLMAHNTKDTGLRFEQSGCDYLFIDEAHLYKNKQRVCNIDELSCSKSSQRAEDLSLKLGVLRERRRDEARARGIPARHAIERVATFATGTPIANSLGELWVMQTYLRPDLLEAAGVADLGDWGAAFTAAHTTVEVNSTGTKLRPVTRVGRYTNLHELLALSSSYTDVVLRDQVPVELPALRGGARRIVSVQPDIEVVDFIADLGWRADHLDSRNPRRDNILKISTDGRNASLDPRLAHLGAPANSRAAAVADNIMRNHHEHADRAYVDPDTGSTMPIRGGLQVVFCDRGTPSKDAERFTIYQAINDDLIARGMPASTIRFVHEARNHAELKALFAQCNKGEVSVLIGSTEKMGTGTNIQRRMTALYHVDVPWRPADLEQREGRILRQGNQNKQVEIVNFVAEGTYDTVMWQRVQAKALFIDQMRRNEIQDNEIEDLSGGDIGAAAAETKAVATGDPRYIRQVELDDTVRRLTALESAHNQSVRNRDWHVTMLERAIPAKQNEIDTLAPVADLATQRAAAEKPNTVTVAGSTFADRPAAARALAEACRRTYLASKEGGASRYMAVGASINGVDILAARDLTHDRLLLRLDVPSRTTEIEASDVLSTAAGLGADMSGSKQLGLLRRVENLYGDLPAHRDRLEREQQRQRTELGDLLANPPAPFEHRTQLDSSKSELDALTMELRLAAQSPEAQAKAKAANERMRIRGRKPGWSLVLNPTPAVVQESGFPNADALRRAARLHERIALQVHQQSLEAPHRDTDTPGRDEEIGL